MIHDSRIQAFHFNDSCGGYVAYEQVEHLELAGVFAWTPCELAEAIAERWPVETIIICSDAEVHKYLEYFGIAKRRLRRREDVYGRAD